MKILLSLVICSQLAGSCLEPYEWPTRFDTQYDCLMFGYEESIKKMKEIGRADVNQYNMFVKFYCTPDKTIWYYGKIVVWQQHLTTITYPYFSLFRIGVSWFHIHSNKTAGEIKRLVTNTANKIATTIFHYMCIKWCFMIRS